MEEVRKLYEGRSWNRNGDEPKELMIGVFEPNIDKTDYNYEKPKKFYKRIEIGKSAYFENKNLQIIQKWILRSHKDVILNNADISDGLEGKFTFSCFINGGWTDEEPMTFNKIFEKYKSCFLGWEFVHAFIRIDGKNTKLEHFENVKMEESDELDSNESTYSDTSSDTEGSNGQEKIVKVDIQSQDIQDLTDNNLDQQIEVDTLIKDESMFVDEFPMIAKSDDKLITTWPSYESIKSESSPSKPTFEPIDTKCDFCGKRFWDEEILRSHIYNAHEKIKTYKCDSCDESFHHSFQLKKHIRRIHEGITNDFICDLCGNNYNNKWGLKVHVSSAHDETTYPCESCEKIFKNKWALTLHVKCKHTKGTKVYPCNQCSMTFVQQSLLRHHIKKVHEKVKDQPCPKCDKKFLNQSHLERHVKIVHEKIKENVCERCHKAFGTLSALRLHIKTVHEKIKEFTCVPCKKDYSCSSTFKQHIERFHGNAERMKCQQCEKTFKVIQDLRHHVKIVHEKVRNHKCDFCDKSFAITSNKYTHMTKHHSDLLIDNNYKAM